MNNEDDLKSINEIIAGRFSRVTEGVLSATTPNSLFENLLGGIEKEFAVPFVWLSLIDDEIIMPIIEEMESSGLLKSRFSVVSQEFMDTLLTGGMKPVLANQNLKPFYRLLPPSRKYFVRSIAVVPFALDGRMIGTWNNGDADANRYEPDMKTDFIEKLASQISEKLSQLVRDRKNVPEPSGEDSPSGGLP